MRSHLRYYIIVILFLCITLTGCKVMNDTKMGIAFHNMVAHYNVYFNANETYKAMVKQTEDAHTDNFNSILDVYRFGDENILKNNSSSVDNILKKCSKILDKHEKSKWIDDTYFLIARSYFYKADFYAAMEAFQYLISTYPKTEIAYKSMIWLACCDIMLKKYDDAEAMTSMAKSETDLPPDLYENLYLTTAFVKIRKGDYPSAIENLKKAIPREKKKENKTRYMFILAQLYLKTEQFPLAAENFNSVIKRNPDYDMAFNAKLEISRCYPINSDGDARFLRKQLLQMLKDDKNIQYRDQIYFELALIELKLNNTEKAEFYLRKSIENSKSNQNQKAIAYMLLGDNYFNKGKYILSKKYYDSTEVSLTKEYPDYNNVKARNALRMELLDNLVIIETEDSLLKLANMSKSQRDSVIDKAYMYELSLKRKEEEKQRAQQLQENQEMDFNRQVMNRDRNFMQMPNDASNWYFSNPSTVQMGQSEFYVKWGKRVLEDDWRRKKKDMNIQGMSLKDSSNIVKKKEVLVISETDKQALSEYISSYSKEKQKYYQNIPITQGMQDISNDKITEALKAAGDIYSERLRDTVKAISTYEDLLKRYPDNRYRVEVHYKLYNLYTAENKPDKAQPHKDFVLTNYPNSEYALLLSDPDAFTKLQEQKITQAENFYSSMYRMFMNDSCEQLIPLIEKNKSELLTQYQAKLEFMSLVCRYKNKPKDEFVSELRKFISTYINYDISKQAQNMVDYLTYKEPEIQPRQIQKKDSVVTKSRFLYDENSTHYFFCLYPAKYPKVSELKIAFSDYNKQYFELSNLDISTMLLNKESQMLIIKQFQNKEKAQEYLEGLVNDNNYVSRISLNVNDFYIISEKNFYLLLEDQSTKAYNDFFQKNYIE